MPPPGTISTFYGRTISTWPPPSRRSPSQPSPPAPSSATPLYFSPTFSTAPLASLPRPGEFPLRPISDDARRTDLQATLSRGNHKSARGHETKLLAMLKEEVEKGWQLPLPKEAALELPGCAVAPLGVVSQWTIEADRSRQAKLRLTQNQSFNTTPGEKRNVNDRVITDNLTPARFGRALMRLLHYICLLQRRFPGERLLMTKVDCKSAYGRIHLQAAAALKACAVIAGMLLVALRLTIGGPEPVSVERRFRGGRRSGE